MAMLFWLISAVMTVAAVWVLIRPLTATRGASRPAAASAVARFQAELATIETDRARDEIDDVQATAAKVEASRRLLAEAGDKRGDAQTLEAAPRPALMAGLLAGLPVAAAALYLMVGSPGLPGAPYAARISLRPDQATAAELVARVEERLRAHPEDGQGWDVIAPVYLQQDRFADARQAFDNAIRLNGESSRRLAGFAEATVLANGGIVTEEARKAYEKLSRLEPDRAEPRFWLALAMEQDGALQQAADAYRALLATAPEAAPWRATVDERLASVTARLAGTGAVPAPGADAAAIADLPPAERARRIEAMVEGLAERLKADGRDAQGWQRLLRAYVVLGDRTRAQAALTAARTALAGDSSGLAAVNAVAAELGIGS